MPTAQNGQTHSNDFLVTGESQGLQKEHMCIMGYTYTIFIAIISTCCIKCFAFFRIDIQQLFDKTVDCFFLKELRNPKIVVVQRLAETTPHVALMVFTITVSHQGRACWYYKFQKLFYQSQG